MTDELGNAMVPLPVDVIYQTSNNPNSRTMATYNMVLTYTQGVDTYTAAGAASFINPYPNLSPGYMQTDVAILFSTLVLDLPDLYVQNLVYDWNTAYDRPYAGDNLDIIVSIANQGHTAARNVQVVVICYEDGNVAVLNVTYTVASVAPNDAVIVVLPTTTWSDVPAGSHVISVTIDPNGTIPEVIGGKDNNKATLHIEVYQKLPDLSITSTDIINSPFPVIGDPVTTVITVHNIGLATATDALVQVYAGGDKDTGVLVGTSHVTASPGVNEYVTISWYPNMVGTYPVYVYLNAYRTITESNYSNNIASTPITVRLATDYAMDWIFNGTSEHANLTIPETTIDFEVRTNITIEGYGMLVLDGTMMKITQKGNYALKITVKDHGSLVILNAGRLTSNYDIRVYLIGNAQLIVDGSDITAKIKIQADDNADLYLASSNVYADLVAPETSSAIVTARDSNLASWSQFGGSAKAYLTNVSMPAVKAYGLAEIVIYQYIEVVVYDGNGFGIEDAFVEVNHITRADIAYVGYTDANGRIVFKVLSDIYYGNKDTELLGSYLLNADFTYGSVVYNADETNYPVSIPSFDVVHKGVKAPATFKISSALPDLDPPLIVSDTTPLRNETVTVKTLVNNTGVVIAHNVRVLFNDTYMLDGVSKTVTFHSELISSIAPGAGVWVNTTWLAWYPLGEHNISVVIDPYHAIKEMSAINNSNYTLVQVMGITDLYIQRSDVTLDPYAPVRQDSVSIEAFVHNKGDLSAENVWIIFYAQYPGTMAQKLNEGSIGLIDVGEFGNQSARWTPGMAGDYTITITINNQTAISFVQKVLDFADLKPTNIVYNPASPVVVNTDVVVTATIKNIGDSTAYSFVVQFFLGGTSGTMIGQTIVGSAASQSSVDVSIVWNAVITNGQKIQDNSITVWVNPERLIAEKNYDNNEFSQTIKVKEVRPDLYFPNNITVTKAGSVVTHASMGESIRILTNVSNSGVTPALGAEIVFYIKDADNKTAVIGTVYKDIGVNEIVGVLADWTINLGKGNYTLIINANPDHIIEESNTTNDQVTLAFVIDSPNLGLTINPLGTASYASGTTIYVSGKVTNPANSGPLSGVIVSVYFTQGGVRKSSNVTATSLNDGTFSMPVYIPDGLSGTVELNAVANNAEKSTAFATQITVKSTADNGVPWYVYLLILVCIAAVIIGFSMYLYKYGLGKMVECGECGALIPDSSRKCPKCGTEFEVGTAKCSECNAWIPSNSTSCPECGAKFLTQAIAEEEDAYLKKMRIQYEGFAETFKDEAKRVLGKKYHENKFMEWWKKQPSYMSFENWLAQEENKRKTGGIACPSCGTLNPRGASICHQCGTVIEQPKQPEGSADEQKADGRKPLRRIVRRPVEKKPEEAKSEEMKPEENKPQT
jgi:ribosomal protein L40E